MEQIEMIEKNRLIERESREINDIINLIAENALDYVITNLTVDRVKSKYIQDGCKKPFTFPDGSKLTLDIKLSLGKKKKKSSVKKNSKL